MKPGDRVWVKSPTHGFVGVGRVTAVAEPASSFTVKNEAGEPVPVQDVLRAGHYHMGFINDLDACEWFVPVRWGATVPAEKAVNEFGLFGNQNTVCRPTTPKWRTTVERLKACFPGYDG